jgi:hypothetical protein
MILNMNTATETEPELKFIMAYAAESMSEELDSFAEYYLVNFPRVPPSYTAHLRAKYVIENMCKC